MNNKDTNPETATPQESDPVCQVCHGSGSVWRSQGEGDPDYEADCLACHPDAPQTPNGEEVKGMDGSQGSPAEAAPYIEKDEEALHPAGTFVEYKEDDQIMICRVLENACDKEWLRYKLEVVKQYHGHFLCKDPEVGKVFDVSSNRKYCISGMWGVWHVGTYCDGKFIMAAMQEAKPWAGKAVAA